MKIEKDEKFVFLWEKKSEKEIRLFRVFGENGCIKVPSRLDGKEVSEIGDYCFSKRRFPDKQLFYTKYEDGNEQSGLFDRESKITDSLYELSEKYVEQVMLPDTVEKIGACAFYNCTALTELTVYPELSEVGSDVFMNCLKLRTVHMKAKLCEKTGLKQLLAQMKWQVFVSFESGGTVTAVFLYPEYDESYNEIGPAHIFELNLTGEGFRARQCFKEGVFLPESYDSIFPQACVEETKEVLIPMAWNRLFYGTGLQDEARKYYEDYIKEHASDALQLFLKTKDLDALYFFFADGYGSKQLLEEAVKITSGAAWTEGTANLMKWNRDLFGRERQKEDVKERYSFD